ncbi:MFS transporter [Amnibacterium kyonggiense]
MTDIGTSQPRAHRGQSSPTTLREAWLALVGLSAVFLFEMLDNSILNVALPTIGRDLHASTTDLQWVTGVYSVVFGGMMLLFGSVADRVGRRRVMLVGLAILGGASLATVLVTTPGELIAVRALMGVAAAMTTPGTIALAFRLFPEDRLRVRAISIVSTVGIVGLAVGPTAGGLVLAVLPWQVLLLVNAPIAALAIIAIGRGIAADDRADLHPAPIDAAGAVFGTVAVVLALVTSTLFLQSAPWVGWVGVALTLGSATAFVLRERAARHPLLDLALLAKPLVASGLAYKAATGIALAGMSYLVTLQLQLDYGWPPALAAVGLLPQVLVLLGLSPFVDRIVTGLGFDRTAWLSSASVVVGVTLYGLTARDGYGWVAASLVLVAAGIRVNGVVAGTNVLRGLPADRTSIGAALVDTAQEIAAGIGIAITGTVLALVFTGPIASTWSEPQRDEFHVSASIAALALAAIAAILVLFGTIRTRSARHDG